MVKLAFPKRKIPYERITLMYNAGLVLGGKPEHIPDRFAEICYSLFLKHGDAVKKAKKIGKEEIMALHLSEAEGEEHIQKMLDELGTKGTYEKNKNEFLIKNLKSNRKKLTRDEDEALLNAAHDKFYNLPIYQKFQKWLKNEDRKKRENEPKKTSG